MLVDKMDHIRPTISNWPKISIRLAFFVVLQESDILRIQFLTSRLQEEQAPLKKAKIISQEPILEFAYCFKRVMVETDICIAR